MLIDNLQIQCFRGISDSLSLDFTAPLTVLYAPNGTGKTSVCDAVEWVLCGGVGRLGKDESIRCKLGDDSLKTTVEASIPQNGSPFFIKRELSGSAAPLYWKDIDCDYTVATDQELLRRFVKALPPSGNSNKAKVDWVRSTRFLESDSLRLLIDSDKESNDTRKLIFSSLFGVAEYQKNERDLNRILGKLPSERKINTEISKINKKIEEYEELIKKLTAEQTAPYRDHVYNLLSTISDSFGIAKNTDKETDLQKYHETLEVHYIKHVESLVEKKSILAFIRDKVGIYQEYLSNYEALNKTIDARVSKQASLTQDLNKKQAEIAENQESSQKRDELINELHETVNRIKDEKATWLSLYNLYTSIPLEVGVSKNRSTEISNYIVSTEQRISTLNEKLLLVGELINLLPSWQKKHAELRGIGSELEALRERKSKDASDIPLAEQTSKIKSELDALQSSREKVLGEINLLLSSGKKYVETHAEDSKCPLCEHDHESNFVLQEKINTRFSKLSSKSKEEAVLASRLDELTQLLIQENNDLKKAEELARNKIVLINAIQETSDKLIAVGLEKSDISKPESVSEKLEGLQVKNQATLEKLRQNIAPYKSGYEAVSKLEEMRITTQSLLSLWCKRLEISGEESFDIDGIGHALEKLEAALENKINELKRLREDSKPNVKKLSDELLKLDEESKKISADIASAKEQITPIRNFIQEYKRKWSTISEADVLSDAQIENAAVSIVKKEQMLNEIKGLFTKVEEYFVKIKESEIKEREHGLYQKEIKEAQDELKEWNHQAKARSVVEAEIDLIKEEIRRFIAEEIRPLTNIINTLYLRAQGNRFINSIEARPSKEGFLEWIAELNDEGESFEKMRSLSQGQRQDLALSIFLARARSLGGTFFLDEPLAHLDDLNRVALLDTLRIIVSEQRATNPLRLVLTTASNNLLRHLREKFSLVEDADGRPALRIYKMSGNPKVGLHVEPPELVHSPNRLLTHHSIHA